MAGALVITIAAFHVALIALYRFIDPPGSNLVLAKAIQGEPVKQTWVDLDDVSPALIKAVLTSEDARFCSHWGVDWHQIRLALASAGASGPRGASTISMQTAKNLFLWPGRSYVRKALELPLTYTMELLWPKRRMLEIYLNVAQWGPNIFGAEAAARHHFKKSARKLTAREAALLAAALPNPYQRKAGRPGRKTRRHAGIVSRRMKAAENWSACVLES